jgi:VIT1/CCC1 family predicted Fe2+/Mn2+ transporter
VTDNIAVDAKHQESHTPAAIRARLQAGPDHSYLRDFIYGAIDGSVTTFAVVSGVAGAGLDSKIVIILGLANLIGDGFSMAAGNFLGVRAEQQLRDQARHEEETHIAQFPEGEREEIRQIFASKGFAGKDLDRAVKIITADINRWVDTMLKEEHGLSLQGPKPLRAALTTFLAFLLVGAIPLLPFLVNVIVGEIIPEPFYFSMAMTGAAFFVVGAFKSRFVRESWYRAGLETLVVGGTAAGLAFLVGVVLKSLGIMP